MAMLKIKNEHGGWDEILALRGRDGAIQYTAGANIEISSDNVISAVGLEGTVTREDVQIMIGDAVPTKTSDLDNDSGFITNASIPSKTSDLTNDSGFITSGDIPTKTSDLTNDSGFITAAQIPAEQEPDFNASVAKTITQTDINNWNGKQNPIQFNTAYSASTNKAATMADMPFVPTKLSDLTNDSGYALRSELPTVPTKLSDLTNDTGFVTNSAIPTKTSDLTNDSNYATLSDIPTVPTKLSDLTNDTGYITNASVPTKVSDLTNDSGFITSGDIPPIPEYTSDLINDSDFITYNDLPTIPSKTSDLINDSGFITSSSVPTKTSQLRNDSGFVTSAAVPDVTTELRYNSYNPLTYSGGSYSLNSVYYYLNKVLVKNGSIDDTQIGLYQIQSNETGFTAITGKNILDFKHFFKNSNSDYQSAAYGTTLLDGFDENDYDVQLCTDWGISHITNYSTYAEITFSRQYLFAYSANILSSNPNHYALRTDVKTIKFTKYTTTS